VTTFVWVLRLEVGGQRWWLVSSPLTLTAGGSVVPTHTGLRVQASPSGLTTTAASSGGAAVEVLQPATMGARDWWRLGLTAGAVELALVSVTNGAGTWERRVATVVGRVSGLSWGDADEVLAFDVRLEAEVTASTVPPPLYRVDSVSWPTAPDGAMGRSYPLPYGVPGAGRETALSYDTRALLDWAPTWELPAVTRLSAKTRATPCIPVSRLTITIDPTPWDTSGSFTLDTERVDKLLVAGAPIGASTVGLWCRYAESWYYDEFTVDLEADGRGVVCSVIDLTAAQLPVRRAQEWWASYPNGGGIYGDDGRPLGSLGRMVLWMLRRTGLRWDVARTAAAAARLDVYQIDGYLDDPVSPLDWLSERLSVYPMAMDPLAPGGLAVYAIPWEATFGDAVASLTVGAGVQRVGTVRSMAPDRPVERVRVRAAYSQSHGTYTLEAVASLGAVAEALSPSEVVVEAPDVQAAGSAALLARYHLWQSAPWHAEVTLSVASALWSRLTAGDVVLVTDEGIGWEFQPCWVSSLTRTDGPWWSITVRPLRPMPGVVTTTARAYGT
jgi:hypothetical protein